MEQITGTGKIPRYNADGHLVLPNGVEFWGEPQKSMYYKSEFRTPGTYTFTVPAGVTSIKVEIAGAGGGGGGNKSIGYNGGDGELITASKTVNASETSYAVVVGKGGGCTQDGLFYCGVSGGNSSVADIVTRGGGGGNQDGNNQDGVSYDNGGRGGAGAANAQPGSGGNGWVIIECWGDVL